MGERRSLVQATVVGVNDASFLYPSCIQCYAKMLHNVHSNVWQCVRCNQTRAVSDLRWRYRLSLCVADSSSTANLSLFGGTLLQHFGCDADTFHQFISGSHDNRRFLEEDVIVQAVCTALLGRSFIFCVKMPNVKTSAQDAATSQPLKADRGIPKPACVIDLLSAPPSSQRHDGKLSDLVAVQMIPTNTQDAERVTVLDVLQQLVHGSSTVHGTGSCMASGSFTPSLSVPGNISAETGFSSVEVPQITGRGNRASKVNRNRHRKSYTRRSTKRRQRCRSSFQKGNDSDTPADGTLLCLQPLCSQSRSQLLCSQSTCSQSPRSGWSALHTSQLSGASQGSAMFSCQSSMDGEFASGRSVTCSGSRSQGTTFQCHESQREELHASCGTNRASHREELHASCGTNRASHREELHLSCDRNRASHREELHLSCDRNRASHREELHASCGTNRASHREELHLSCDRNRASHREELHASCGTNRASHREELHLSCDRNRGSHREERHDSSVYTSGNTSVYPDLSEAGPSFTVSDNKENTPQRTKDSRTRSRSQFCLESGCDKNMSPELDRGESFVNENSMLSDKDSSLTDITLPATGGPALPQLTQSPFLASCEVFVCQGSESNPSGTQPSLNLSFNRHETASFSDSLNDSSLLLAACDINEDVSGPGDCSRQHQTGSSMLPEGENLDTPMFSRVITSEMFTTESGKHDGIHFPSVHKHFRAGVVLQNKASISFDADSVIDMPDSEDLSQFLSVMTVTTATAQETCRERSDRVPQMESPRSLCAGQVSEETSHTQKLYFHKEKVVSLSRNSLMRSTETSSKAETYCVARRKSSRQEESYRQASSASVVHPETSISSNSGLVHPEKTASSSSGLVHSQKSSCSTSSSVLVHPEKCTSSSSGLVHPEKSTSSSSGMVHSQKGSSSGYGSARNSTNPQEGEEGGDWSSEDLFDFENGTFSSSFLDEVFSAEHAQDRSSSHIASNKHLSVRVTGSLSPVSVSARDSAVSVSVEHPSLSVSIKHPSVSVSVENLSHLADRSSPNALDAHPVRDSAESVSVRNPPVSVSVRNPSVNVPVRHPPVSVSVKKSSHLAERSSPNVVDPHRQAPEGFGQSLLDMPHSEDLDIFLDNLTDPGSTPRSVFDSESPQGCKCLSVCANHIEVNDTKGIEVNNTKGIQVIHTKTAQGESPRLTAVPGACETKQHTANECKNAISRIDSTFSAQTPPCKSSQGCRKATRTSPVQQKPSESVDAPVQRQGDETEPCDTDSLMIVADSFLDCSADLFGSQSQSVAAVLDNSGFEGRSSSSVFAGTTLHPNHAQTAKISQQNDARFCGSDDVDALSPVASGANNVSAWAGGRKHTLSQGTPEGHQRKKVRFSRRRQIHSVRDMDVRLENYGIPRVRTKLTRGTPVHARRRSCLRLPLTPINSVESRDPLTPILSTQSRDPLAPISIAQTRDSLAPILSVQSRDSLAPISSAQTQSRDSLAPILSVQTRDSLAPSPILSVQTRTSLASISSAQTQSRDSLAPILSVQSRDSLAPISSVQTRDSLAPISSTQSIDSLAPVLSVQSRDPLSQMQIQGNLCSFGNRNSQKLSTLTRLGDQAIGDTPSVKALPVAWRTFCSTPAGPHKHSLNWCESSGSQDLFSPCTLPGGEEVAQSQDQPNALSVHVDAINKELFPKPQPKILPHSAGENLELLVSPASDVYRSMAVNKELFPRPRPNTLPHSAQENVRLSISVVSDGYRSMSLFDDSDVLFDESENVPETKESVPLYHAVCTPPSQQRVVWQSESRTDRHSVPEKPFGLTSPGRVGLSYASFLSSPDLFSP